VVARGQPTIPRIGYVWIGAGDTDMAGAGLRQGLADAGYVIGRNLALEVRYAEGHSERIPELIAELLALNVEVLVAPGTQKADSVGAERPPNLVEDVGKSTERDSRRRLATSQAQPDRFSILNPVGAAASL
jgi:putative tryptophan/tyrosine transport system substrate-binding protein